MSPSKVKPVADLVRGRPVEEALMLLRFTPRRAAQEVAKVVKSAAANAENNFQLDPVGLRVARISVDHGPVLKRYRPQARGRVSPLLKRSCHITVVVAEEVGHGA
jgi:large subunit ribosomal protein L22